MLRKKYDNRSQRRKLGEIATKPETPLKKKANSRTATEKKKSGSRQHEFATALSDPARR